MGRSAKIAFTSLPGGIALLKQFFEANDLLFLFADGLVFFMLGVVAALASHVFRESRLGVARGLPWLALFGLLVGAAKWGGLFIPLQASYLPGATLQRLGDLQSVLLVAGHGALLRFGLGLGDRPRWLSPTAIMLGGAAFGAAFLHANAATFETFSRGLAAYTLGLPGAVLSGWGLYRQGLQLGHLYPRPARAMRLAAWAFLLSVPVGPLALPLDGTRSVRIAGIPAEVGLIGGGLILTLTLFTGLEALRVEHQRRVDWAERREAVLEERYRLARSLNDDVIQELVGAGFLLEAAEPELPTDSRSPLSVVKRQLAGAVQRLRAHLMDIPPMDWEEQDLLGGLGLLVARFQADSLLPVHLEVAEGLTASPDDCRALYGMVQAGLSSARHRAGARQAWVRLRAVVGGWQLEIGDDGEARDTAGEGLEEVRAAAARVGGRVRVDSAPGIGTRILITLLMDSIVSRKWTNGMTPRG